MPAPQSRTGFKQAAHALRRHGLRPARTERTSLKDKFRWKFLAVPLQKGLRDECLTPEHVQFSADTLSDLVSVVEAGKQTTTSYQPPQESRPTATLTATEAAIERQKQAPALNREVSLNGSQVTPEALNALRALLGGGVDRDAVRRILEEEFSTRLHNVRLEAQERQEKHIAELEARTQEAIKSLQGLVSIPVEIRQTGQDPVKVEGQHREFSTLVRLLGLGQNVYAVGPAGSGKTTAMLKAAECLGRRAYVQTSLSDVFEAKGFKDVTGEFQETPVYQWAKHKGAVLILDEIDRSDANALCSLHSMIENGRAVFACGEVEVDPSNLVCATANTFGIGPDAEYVGSNRLDAATLNRFPARITWDYDEALESRIGVANGCEPSEIAFGQRIRREINKLGIRIVWSPRDVVSHAVRVANGFSREESLRLSCLASLEPGQREQILKAAQ